MGIIINPKELESVQKFLKEELNYCGCASSAALEVLYKTLLFASEMPNSPSKLNKLEYFPWGWGEWFIYFLESKNLLWHGFNNIDLGINDLGQQLLEGLENFYEDLGLDLSILNDIADDYLKIGMLQHALRSIDKFQVKFPQESIGFFTKSEILFAMEQYNEALESIEKSIELEDAEDKQILKKNILEKIESN
jgi:tetratricopeptide (TPR) repeat protein